MRYTPMLALALAACNSQPARDAAPTPAGRSDIQRQIAALGDAERNGVMIRAIRDAGFDCQQVTGSVPQRDPTAQGDVYTARCSDNAAYAVVIGRDGTAQVVGAR